MSQPYVGEIRLFAGALSASLVAFFVVAFVSSVEYLILPYFLMGYSIALVTVSLRSRQRRASEGGHDPHAMKREHQLCVG